MPSSTRPLVLTSLLVAQIACAPGADPRWVRVVAAARPGAPVVLEVVPRKVIRSLDGTRAYHGGYGSALAVDRQRGVFYLLTDRGPNLDGTQDDEKRFVAPSFAPEIGVFQIRSGRLVRTRRIELRDSGGARLTGLPNPPGRGGTGEHPVGPEGKPLKLDPNGLDSEGLVALDDGGFWISDEYGPCLVHVDRRGRTLERVSPFGRGRRLPAVLARRRPNRGMEGLTYLQRDRTLVGLMQSPLDNPKSAGRKSTSVRIVFYDLQDGTSRQYLYPLDDSHYSVSEIAAVGPRTFLVIEQDPGFPGAPRGASALKRIYAIDLSGATDVGDPADNASGLRNEGRTIEELSAAELSAAGIVRASKRLVVDLLDPALGYRHDKAEGLALLGDGLLAVANDDDFGIESGKYGACVPKRDPVTGEVDRNQVCVIRTATPLDSLVSR